MHTIMYMCMYNVPVHVCITKGFCNNAHHCFTCANFDWSIFVNFSYVHVYTTPCYTYTDITCIYRVHVSSPQHLSPVLVRSPPFDSSVSHSLPPRCVGIIGPPSHRRASVPISSTGAYLPSSLPLFLPSPSPLVALCYLGGLDYSLSPSLFC